MQLKTITPFRTVFATYYGAGTFRFHFPDRLLLPPIMAIWQRDPDKISDLIEGAEYVIAVAQLEDTTFGAYPALIL